MIRFTITNTVSEICISKSDSDYGIFLQIIQFRSELLKIEQYYIVVYGMCYQTRFLLSNALIKFIINDTVTEICIFKSNTVFWDFFQKLYNFETDYSKLGNVDLLYLQYVTKQTFFSLKHELR